MRTYFGCLRSGAFGSYDVDEVSRETSMVVDPLEISRTIQSAKDECDINVIVRRFGITSQMPTSVRLPSYGDYDTVADFQTAMNQVREAEESFMTLPSGIRSRFGNNPQAFLEFVADPSNVPEIVKMGLASRVDPVIIPVRDVSRETGDDDGTGKRGSAERSPQGAGKRSKASEGSGGSSSGESGGS